MYGAQACFRIFAICYWFENDVEMYGAQAAMNCDLIIELFENDVEMYGAQASLMHLNIDGCLRMM